jgi:uncharacterized membrane protein YdjX (TVP38/TMEM64 family)
MSLFYLSLVVLISCLLGSVLSYLATRRAYRAQLQAAQADAAEGWADYYQVRQEAARWKRNYYTLQGRA